MLFFSFWLHKNLLNFFIINFVPHQQQYLSPSATSPSIHSTSLKPTSHSIHNATLKPILISCHMKENNMSGLYLTLLHCFNVPERLQRFGHVHSHQGAAVFGGSAGGVTIAQCLQGVSPPNSDLPTKPELTQIMVMSMCKCLHPPTKHITQIESAPIPSPPSPSLPQQVTGLILALTLSATALSIFCRFHLAHVVPLCPLPSKPWNNMFQYCCKTFFTTIIIAIQKINAIYIAIFFNFPISLQYIISKQFLLQYFVFSPFAIIYNISIFLKYFCNDFFLGITVNPLCFLCFMSLIH